MSQSDTIYSATELSTSVLSGTEFIEKNGYTLLLIDKNLLKYIQRWNQNEIDSIFLTHFVCDVPRYTIMRLIISNGKLIDFKFKEKITEFGPEKEPLRPTHGRLDPRFIKPILKER